MTAGSPDPRAPGSDAAPAERPVTVVSVVGARPNFMKVAPIARQMAKKEPTWRHRIVHTGQHYDANMSDVFFRDLEMPEPDVHLGVGSGTHAEQTARVMLALDPYLETVQPDLLSVVGDVNSTLAATLVGVKRGVPVAHVEAGLRSFDREMPEEINRMLTDAVADLLLTPSRDADENLQREGVDAERIRFVGNVMIDSLQKYIPRARQQRAWEQFGLAAGSYALVTLHRPSNVDDPATLRGILDVLTHLAARVAVLFPVHPRTRKMLEQCGHADLPRTLRVLDPIGYLEFLSLESGARLVLTDSGGIQEETTVLGVPCLTLRANTERPISVTEGTNQIVGSNPETVWRAAQDILARPMPQIAAPEFWDGRAAERIVAVFQSFINDRRASMRQTPDVPA